MVYQSRLEISDWLNVDMDLNDSLRSTHINVNRKFFFNLIRLLTWLQNLLQHFEWSRLSGWLVGLLVLLEHLVNFWIFRQRWPLVCHWSVCRSSAKTNNKWNWFTSPPRRSLLHTKKIHLFLLGQSQDCMHATRLKFTIILFYLLYFYLLKN